jgi:acetylornithine/succinyldiaminopimelate/putrescine aminotransferase
MSAHEKARIETDFGRHLSRGQVAYLKAGHLDVIENDRQGVHFTDPRQGRRFFDAFTSAGCFNVGRHNPVVLQALLDGLDAVDVGSPLGVSEARVALAERLTALAPGDLDRVIFAAGGGDAIDAALKLARGATGRDEVLCTVKAYHGHTGLALSANGKAHYRRYFEPLAPGFRFVPFGDLAAMEAAASERTAAILVEPVQGEAGIFPGSPEYLRGLRALADRVGAVLVFDEVQTGFGRTGRLFACEHSGVVPDVLALAKSMGGGLYASAAVLYRAVPLLTDFVESHPHFHPSSVGGSDLACRVSLAVLDEIVGRRLWENAERQGARLQGALRALQAEHPKILKEVRGLGLMVGVEYLHEFMGPMMSDALAKEGVFAAYSGNAPQVMRFMVPLTITDEEMDALVAAIRRAFAAMRVLLPLALPAARIPTLLRLLNDERVQTALFGALRRVEDLLARVRPGGGR